MLLMKPMEGQGSQGYTNQDSNPNTTHVDNNSFVQNPSGGIGPVQIDEKKKSRILSKCER